jgi:acetylornithine deacetylase/succinyl-diaminopimelate desuccinylase-like protein
VTSPKPQAGPGARSRLYSTIERRRRFASRVALYTSLALVMAAAFVLRQCLDQPLQANAAERWIQTDYLSLPEVKLLREYVRIDTSKATGDEVAGARFLARQLAAAGIQSDLERLGGRHANLYALLPGRDPRPLVLHSHIDVSDVDPQEWFFPPFEAHVELPWLYGRGVFDMKSIGIAELLAMIDLKRSGAPLARSVLFLATGGEESGSELGTRWVIRMHPELVRGFYALLTEGGTVEARTRSDVKYWGTEVGQKHFAEMRVCSASRQRLEDLRRDLRERGHTQTDLLLTPEVRAVLASYGPTRDSAELRSLLARPDELLSDITAFRRLPPFLQSMLRNEAVPFNVEPAPGGGYEILVLFHLLPGQRLAEVRDRLVPPWMLHGLTVSVSDPPVAEAASPAGHPVLAVIDDAIRRQVPNAHPGPFFLPWTRTDARFFRAAGVPCFGFSPFLIMNTDTLQVDQANERLALPGFVDGVALYRKVLRRLVVAADK